MKRAFDKDIVRSVTRSLGRFLAIAAIAALGTGFYAGLRMTMPDMKRAADEFYDGTALMDIRVLSTLGLSDDDIAALRGIEGVWAVMPAFETDVVAVLGGEQYTVRVHSLPEAARLSDTSDKVHARSDDENYLNRPILSEGSWPQNSGECVLSSDLVVTRNVHIGDKLHIIEEAKGREGMLVSDTYTVVGLVSSPYYATSSSLGTTSLGSGSIQQYMFVPEDDFSNDFPYTEAFLAVAGARDTRAESAAYYTCVEAVTDRISEAAPAREQIRADEVRGWAQEEYDEAYAAYERQKADAETQLENAKNELDAAAAALAENEQNLSDGQKRYDDGVADLENQRVAIRQQLDDFEQQLQDGQSRLETKQAELQEAAGQLDSGWAAWYAQQDAFNAAYAQWQSSMNLWQKAWAANEAYPLSPFYQSTKEILEVQKRKLDEGRAELAQNEENLNNAKAVLDEKQRVYDESAAQLEAASENLAQNRRDFEQASQQSASRLADARSQLDAAALKLETGREQLERGKAEWESGFAEYENARIETERQLLDAEDRLRDAHRQIEEIENPRWYVMDRRANFGVAGFNADANRIDSIAQVFPLIFFLVAALVALTTMTRMVEEERTLIGTYKALGYSRVRITMKYIIYAAGASVLGSIIGIAILSQVLPLVIMGAYGIIYFVPTPSLPFSVDAGAAAMAAGLGIGIILVATAVAAAATLRERPSALMLPRAPCAGKRIFMEKIAPLWRRLSFSWKVTCRNLFRYKKRFIMTIIGVAGCTALLLTGLGLSDAINDVIDNQFGQILMYNTTVTLEDDEEAVTPDELDAVLNNSSLIENSTRVQYKNMQATGCNEADEQVRVMVAQDADDFGNFVTMRTRLGHNALALDGNGVILSEKLAKRLDADIGDSVYLTEQDAIGNATGLKYEVTVSGIMENYIYNYAFMSAACYEKMANDTPSYSTVLALAPSDSKVRAELNRELGGVRGVKTVAYNDETIDTYRDMLSSISVIVIVLIVAAATLAFVVLYNLTNINITERQREIATLKVLGFTPREVYSYIYREVALLSLMGAALGLVLGVWMESFVVVTAEVDQVMFGRIIHPESFIIAFVLTMIFSGAVMVVMRRKLSCVDMVKSLKSNE